jgi:hypothetical protein
MSDETARKVIEVPVLDAHGLWPTVYHQAVQHPLVPLAAAIDDRLLLDPETFLREHGYTLAHEFRPHTYTGRWHLHSAVFRGPKKVRFQAGGYWRALWRHAWTPWLRENEWTPQPGVREDPLHPLWVSPSGASYELWNLLGKPREWRWNGLGIALTRAGFDPTTVRNRSHELIARGYAARIERWRNGPPPPPHETNRLLLRAWSWGAGPFLGQDVADSAA